MRICIESENTVDATFYRVRSAGSVAFKIQQPDKCHSKRFLQAKVNATAHSKVFTFDIYCRTSRYSSMIVHIL